MTIQGEPPFFLAPQAPFVTTRGGEYLYRPSMTGLRWLTSLSVTVAEAAAGSAPIVVRHVPPRATTARSSPCARAPRTPPPPRGRRRLQQGGPRGVGDVELVRRALGHALEPRGRVRRVAERRVLEPALGADVADITAPASRPIPILKPSCRLSSRSASLKPDEPVEHVPRRGQRAVGVVLLLQRCSEHGHDAVAHVGDERSAVVEDRLAHRSEIEVERGDHLLRLERLGERGEPRRSLNITVASPRTPPRRRPSASWSTWSTTDSGTKRANARACGRARTRR